MKNLAHLVRSLFFGAALAVSTPYVSGCGEKSYSDCDTGKCCNEVLYECMEDCSGNKKCEDDCGFGYLGCVDRISGSSSRGGSGGTSGGSGGSSGSGCSNECSFGAEKCRETPYNQWEFLECVRKDGCTYWSQKGIYTYHDDCIKAMSDSVGNELENCIPRDHKECGGNKVYWVDSCGSPEDRWDEACSSYENEECKNGECVKIYCKRDCEDDCIPPKWHNCQQCAGCCGDYEERGYEERVDCTNECMDDVVPCVERCKELPYCR